MTEASTAVSRPRSGSGLPPQTLRVNDGGADGPFSAPVGGVHGGGVTGLSVELRLGSTLARQRAVACTPAARSAG